ncbi:MAG TPA: M20/M25/M40 family metallo-hydrolase [Gemmataceae bacterium]|nr:M20/M25/M40 family metallo-hydrolase [Gemmataceae bacterium]
MPAAAPALEFELDTQAATDRLMRFLAVEGITGQEAAIGQEIVAALNEAGVPADAITFDEAHTRIPEPTQTGNLIVKLPGTGKKAARPLLFMTHMDTVPLCAGAEPRVEGRRVVNEVHTALGGDNRTGCAVLVTLAAELIRQKLPHPPLTLLFTVREESGLFGAKHVNPADLGRPALGFNFDGRSAADVIVGAIGADRWAVDVFGKASHAGVAPERGISATMIVSLAMAEVFAGGWFGKVVKDGKEGTSNVGVVGSAYGQSAGDATNVVTDFVRVKGESRSHDAKFVRQITAAYKAAFTAAVGKVKDHEGRTGKVKFTSRLDYVPFRLKDDAAVVKRARAAVEAIGREPNLRVTNGGLDANWMVKHGIPTVTFGAGQNEIHTVKEFVDLVEFESGCRLALAAATGE